MFTVYTTTILLSIIDIIQGFPGPGKYDHSSQFQQTESPFDAAEPPPFGTSEQVTLTTACSHSG